MKKFYIHVHFGHFLENFEIFNRGAGDDPPTQGTQYFEDLILTP